VKKGMVIVFFVLLLPNVSVAVTDFNGNGLWDFLDEIIYQGIPDEAKDVATSLARHLQAFALVEHSQSLALQEATGAQRNTLCLMSVYGAEHGGKMVRAITGSIGVHPEVGPMFRSNEYLIAGRALPYEEDPALWRETYCPASLQGPPQMEWQNPGQ